MKEYKICVESTRENRYHALPSVTKALPSVTMNRVFCRAMDLPGRQKQAGEHT